MTSAWTSSCFAALVFCAIFLVSVVSWLILSAFSIFRTAMEVVSSRGAEISSVDVAWEEALSAIDWLDKENDVV